MSIIFAIYCTKSFTTLMETNYSRKLVPIITRRMHQNITTNFNHISLLIRQCHFFFESLASNFVIYGLYPMFWSLISFRYTRIQASCTQKICQFFLSFTSVTNCTTEQLNAIQEHNFNLYKNKTLKIVKPFFSALF